MEIAIKKLTDTAKVPTRGSDSAAGYDLYADLAEKITIAPHQTVMVGTGLAMEIPEGYFGGVYARSGLAWKQGLRPANCVGVIDSDYRGQLCVPVHNDTDQDRVIEPGERIAQMIIQPYLSVTFQEKDTLTDTRRGQSGFGSTGKC